jgi:hypothetical protein
VILCLYDTDRDPSEQSGGFLFTAFSDHPLYDPFYGSKFPKKITKRIVFGGHAY